MTNRCPKGKELSKVGTAEACCSPWERATASAALHWGQYFEYQDAQKQSEIFVDPNLTLVCPGRQDPELV